MTDTSPLEQQLLIEFTETLRAEAADRHSERESDLLLAKEVALSEVVLARLEEAGAISDYEFCPHEDVSGQRRSRIVAYSLPEDSTRLELFTAHVSGGDDEGPLPSSEVGRLSGWAARFFDHAAKGELDRFASNTVAFEAASRIREGLSGIKEVRVHLITDSATRDRHVAAIEMQGRPVEFEVWDIERLYRTSGEEVSRERIEIDFAQLMGRPIACLEMKPPPKDYQTFLLVLPGDVIFQLYEKYGARLFEFNVRSFLQAKGKVNAGIRKTIENEPERFLAYNNGLTATADSIEVGQWHGETVIHRLKGLQIVNGAQTTSSIHRAKKVDKVDVSALAVAMKLTRVESDRLAEFVPRIAEYANTQNPIQMADLQASSKFHQAFEDLSQKIWCPGEETRWFFERARGSYQVARARAGTTPAKRRDFDETFPKSQYFGKADLAKFLMTWDGHPDSVSKGAQKNHGAFLSNLKSKHGEAWEPDDAYYRHAIAKAILFKSAQSVVRKAKLQSYGANVVTYMIAKLAHDFGERIDLEGVWDTQVASDELEALFQIWAPAIHAALIETAEKRNVTEWCKKEACWDALKVLPLKSPASDLPEFGTVAALTGRGFSEDTSATPNDDYIKQCMAIDAAGWATIMMWVASSKSVEEFDRKVAHTLSGYAMEGWLKSPSEKQAIRGARVIVAARKAGVLEIAS